MSDEISQADTDPFCTVEGFGQAEHVADKSRFIGQALPVDSEEEAMTYVDEVKAEHYDARHVCYGFRIGRGSQCIDRCNDDGEPPRTAGLPIWQVLEGREITDTLVVVIRYYGGVKLGMGGLSRAYREAARLALEAAGVVERFPEEQVSLVVPYAAHDKIEHVFEQMEGVRQLATDYAGDVTMQLAVYRRDLDGLRERLAGLLNRPAGEVFD